MSSQPRRRLFKFLGVWLAHLELRQEAAVQAANSAIVQSLQREMAEAAEQERKAKVRVFVGKLSVCAIDAFSPS